MELAEDNLAAQHTTENVIISSHTPTLNDETLDEQLLKALKDAARYSFFDFDKTSMCFCTMERVLRAGANPNARDSRGKTCLHHIVKQRLENGLSEGMYDKAVMMLLAAGASPYILGDEKSTPLLKLVGTERCSENLLAIEELILDGVDVNETDWRGYTSLHHAARFGEAQIVGILLSAGASPHSTDIVLVNTPLLETMSVEGLTQHQRIKVAQQLIACGADINAINRKGETSLHFACKRGDEMSVEWLLSHEVDINASNYEGFNALLLAMKFGGAELSQSLIDGGCDINYVNTVGVDGDPIRPMTALHVAIMNDDVDMLKSLLEQGANPNQTNDIGDSILYFLLKTRPQNMLPMLELLLSHGVNMYHSGLELLESPMELLMCEDRVTEVEILLEHGLDLRRHIPQFEGDFSPLHEAVTHSACNDMLSLILEYDADEVLDLELEDPYGHSPLYVAVMNRLPDCVELLLNEGADVNHKSRHGESPLAFASFDYRYRVGDDTVYDIIKLLVEAGAKIGSILEELVPNDSTEQAAGGSIEVRRNFFKRAQCIVKYRVLYESRQTSVEEPMSPASVGESNRLRMYYEACKSEIISLRGSSYHNSISYYHMLTANEDIYKRLRDRSVYVKFEEENLQDRFPIYGDDFCERLGELKDLHKMWEEAVKKLGQCLFSLTVMPGFFNPDAYYLIIYNILDYLSDDEWQSLAEA